MQPLSWNLVMLTSYETMQCNGKLYNVHDILFLFCDFDFWFNFFGKHRLTVLLNSCNLILSFANPSGNSLRVYVLFNLVTWPFWSDDNGAVWRLINLLKFQGLSPFFFLFKNIDGWELLICPYVHLRLMHDAPHCPSVRLWGTNCYLSSWPCSWEPIGWELLICP